MNLKSISFYLGLFCFPVSILAFINILYSSYFDYYLSLDTYLYTLFISLLLGFIFYYIGKKSIKKINFVEQLVLIILVYLLVGFLISIPYYFSNFKITLLNSFFESISGLTGTGFSTIDNIKYLDPTLIIWRSSSQWIGGLYFLFFLIFLLSNKSFNFKMTDLTFTYERNFNSEEIIRNDIFKIFLFYVILSVICFTLFNISGVRLFNSLNLSMTLISGGGFLPSENLNMIISTNFQKVVLILSLLLSMLNFFLIFNIINKNIFQKKHNEDFLLLILIFVSVLLIFFNNYDILDILISIISSLANSGISIINDNNNLSLFFLLITMVGGSLISNTSGIKAMRLYILLKITSAEILKLISPNNILNKSFFGTKKNITDTHIKISFLIFISFFLSLLILSSLLIIDEIGFERSFKISILTLTNTVNSELYSLENFNFINLLTSSKISLIIFMIIGKIELISILLIFKKIFLKE